MFSGIGLQGQYFDSVDLSGTPALVRTDAGVDFNWAAGSPDAAINADNFSVRWAGQVEANFTESHSFFVNANDGARLWVNGQLLIDAFDANTLSDATASIDLVAGRRYDVQLEFREVTGDAGVSLEWSSASTPREVIPRAQLFAAERGSISVERFDGTMGNTVGDLNGNANFPDNPNAVSSLTQFAAVSNSGENFGRRVQGLLHAPKTGAYRFYIAADNQAELWLSNTRDHSQSVRIAQVTSAVGTLAFTVNAEQQSSPVQLVAGQSYYIEALHVDNTGADHLAVAWQQPDSSTIEVISGAHLSPILPTVKAYAQQPIISENAATPGRLTVVRSSGPFLNALDVEYDLTGTATNGSDYQTLPGTVTIPAGQASVTIDIQPIADGLDEGDETVQFTLRDGAGYDVGLKSERSVLVTLQDNRDAPAGGVSLWSGTALNDFQRFGASFSTQNVAGVGDVLQVQIASQPSSQFNIQLRQAIASPVAAGDILYAEFQVRSIAGTGQIAAVFEDVSTFAKSLSQGLDVGTEWTRIQLPFTSIADYNTGAATFGFHLGFQAQTLQFANLQLLNFGPPRSLTPETSFSLNNISGTWGTAQSVSVTGQSFNFAYQVETATVPTQNWYLQAIERNEGPVNSGDTMRLSFYLRAVSGADPKTGLAVQRTSGFSTMFSRQISITSDWQLHSFDIDSDADYGPNGLQVAFNLGFGLQTIEIGGFHWENLNNPANLDDLPRQVPAISYGGRDGTDAWRKAADERIEALRMSSVTVQVVDQANQPVDGAVVRLQQTQHGFHFGSAINAYGGKLDPNGNGSARKYQSEITRLFNTVVAENSLKWPGFLQDRSRGLQLADFAVDNGLYLRGHNVIWPSRNSMPANVWTEYDSRVTADGTTSANAWLKTTIEARFDDVIDTFRGIVGEWDVVNEPYTNHDVMDIFGDDIVIEWYQRFRDADPAMKLALNDYSIFTGNGGDTAHRTNFESWLQRLTDANLLNIIGIQSHYGETNLTDMDVLDQLTNTYYSRYATPLAITEFDVNTSDLQLQADYLRDFMTMSFSQPGVDEFLHWGFWENSHWLPDSALYRSDFSIKPNGQAYEDLVFGNWWTDMTGTTRSGSVSTQAFIGQYDVLVHYNNKTYKATMQVDGSGSSNITVLLSDVGTPVLTLNIVDSKINERDGVAATTATVTRTGDLSNPLVVALASSDTGEATLPTTITIAAGETTSAAFAINAIDDGVNDAAQTVTLTASASGFDSGAAQVTVVGILSHRMSNLTVIVQDQFGNPLPSATIDVAMTRHAFQFGTQVQDRFLTITEAEFDALSIAQRHNLIGDYGQALPTPVWQDAVNYRTAVYDNFNHIVPTNGMQWIAYQNTGPVYIDRAIEDAHSRGITVTGHSVVWQNDAWPTPVEFRSESSPDPQVFYDALIADRLSSTGIMTRYSDAGDGPTILEWDVLNEPLHETYYSDTFVGAGIYANAKAAFADYFIRADALRPDAILAVNDYNILSSGGDAAARQYRDLINDLLGLGAPIDQIRVQAHMAQIVSKADLTRRLNILAETGLPISISEFDMRDDANQISPANQQLLFQDMLEAAFEHPAVNGFTMWGFWDPAHWRGNGPLFDAAWNVKAEAAPWFDLVMGDWKPDLVSQPLDAFGNWNSAGSLFQGTYDITASLAGQTAQLNGFELAEDSQVVVTIDVLQDYGDAPAPYPTTWSANGARHDPIGPRLGASRDAETDGQPNLVATGDGNDEDGIMFGVVGLGSPMAGVNIDLQNATEARVDAWLDFDGNGVWEATDQILHNVHVVAGLQTLNFSIPAQAVPGDTYARVRVSSAGNQSATGAAFDGEVEDYVVTLVSMASPAVENVTINGGNAQRSSVTELTVTFDSEVIVPANAFSMIDRDSRVIVDNVIVNSSVIAGKTVSVLTFDPGTSVITRANGNNSLVDGRYQLEVDFLRIAKVGGGPNMAGNYTFGDQAIDGFFRKYGDHNGNGTVDLLDFAEFRRTFGKTLDDIGYLEGFDSDGDNLIGLSDFAAFRRNFGN